MVRYFVQNAERGGQVRRAIASHSPMKKDVPVMRIFTVRNGRQ
jgi:hypothetical protein